MKTTLKTLSAAGLIVTLVFSYFLGTAPLIEGKHIIEPYIDTQFAENYSPEKFDDLKIGMSKTEVLEIIGEPLHTGAGYYDSLVTNYQYTGDGKLLNKNGIRNNQYDDFAWYRSTVGFDTNDIVVFLDNGWSYD